ncbi:MAG: Spy/CpxP family protein refolding chaperone [Pseudomonadota bacterium]
MRWILVVTLSALFATPALAVPGCGDGAGKATFGSGPMANPRFIERVADRLSLSPEQVDTLQGVATTHRDAMQELLGQHKEAMCEFFELMPDDPNYAVATATAGQAAATLAAASVDLVAQLRTDFQAVLTEEQYAEWQIVREEFVQRMAERKERRRGNRDAKRQR